MSEAVLYSAVSEVAFSTGLCGVSAYIRWIEGTGQSERGGEKALMEQADLRSFSSQRQLILIRDKLLGLGKPEHSWGLPFVDASGKSYPCYTVFAAPLDSPTYHECVAED